MPVILIDLPDAVYLSSSKHYRHDPSIIFARSTARDVRSKYQPLMGLIQYEPLAHLVEREFPREKQHHFDGLSKKLNFRKSRRNGETQVMKRTSLYLRKQHRIKKPLQNYTSLSL